MSYKISQYSQEKTCVGVSGVLKNFAIFTGKHLFWSLLLKRDSNRCFPVKNAKLLKTAFFIEHL